MPTSYVIDGYNLIHALGMLARTAAPGELEESRRRLVIFLAQAFGAEGRVTIVFDAAHSPRNVPRHLTQHGLHIEFAPAQQSADDRIETLIEEAENATDLVVVSNDHRLQNAARRRGAQAWSHDALLDFLGKRNARPKPTPIEPGSEKSGSLSPEELKSWMLEFGHLQNDPELKEFFDMDRFE
jgi:predicted RNA-binding protein with PIN domain